MSTSFLSQILFLFQVLFPGKPHFSADDLPDLSGKVVIVTGGNTGIGKEKAKALLAHNAKVYVAARSPEKAEEAIKELHEQTGKKGIYLKLDLADLNSVKAAAEEFLSKETKLDILFNNAGVYCPPQDMLTVQGYDLQIGTNVLGHYYFTKLLLPALLAGAQSSPDQKVRVINTSSVGAYRSYAFDFDLARDTKKRRMTDTGQLYAQSKLGNVLFSNELAKRYGDQGIISISTHPGILDTELFRYQAPIARFFTRLLSYPASDGALTQLWAGSSPEALELNGKYLVPWGRVPSLLPSYMDDKVGKDLWDWCEDQVANI